MNASAGNSPGASRPIAQSHSWDTESSLSSLTRRMSSQSSRDVRSLETSQAAASKAPMLCRWETRGHPQYRNGCATNPSVMKVAPLEEEGATNPTADEWRSWCQPCRRVSIYFTATGRCPEFCGSLAARRSVDDMSLLQRGRPMTPQLMKANDRFKAPMDPTRQRGQQQYRSGCVQSDTRDDAKEMGARCRVEVYGLFAACMPQDGRAPAAGMPPRKRGGPVYTALILK